MKALTLVPALLALQAPTLMHGAETGDLDGDGRISIADVLHLQAGLPPAPGSFDAIASWCEGFTSSTGKTFIYMESLRRNVEGSHPFWLPIDPEWLADRHQEPLPRDDRFTVSVDEVRPVAGAEDEVDIVMTLTLEEVVKAFSLLLDVQGGVLQPPFTQHEQCPQEGSVWMERQWSMPYEMSYCHSQDVGGLEVYVMPPSYLVTRGRYVITRGIPFDHDVLPPSEYNLTVRAKLVGGSQPGEYRIRVHEGSEVVFGDDTIAAPGMSIEGTLRIDAPVASPEAGEGLPPLAFDIATRSVLGEVKFRIVGSSGVPGTEVSPVATARVGDQVRLRIQMETAVPLNDLFVMLNWPADTLSCSNGAITPIFRNPADGRLYDPYPNNNAPQYPQCAGTALGRYVAWYRLAGAWSTPTGDPGNNYPGRLFEYFKPLGEWTDVAEFTVTVTDAAPAGRLPLVFSRWHRKGAGELVTHKGTAFSPYFVDWPCIPEKMPAETLWNYDIAYQDTFVEILRDDDPAPPPDAGIEIHLADAEAAPGELIAVPIIVRSALEPSLLSLRLVLDVDPQWAVVEGISSWILSSVTSEEKLITARRGESGSLVECQDENNDGIPDQRPCPVGHPLFFSVTDRDSPHTEVEWVLMGKDYLASEPYEAGYILMRVSPFAIPGAFQVRGGSFSIQDGGIEVPKESGGWLVGPNASAVFSPARTVRAATVTVRGDERVFIRGDANADLETNISDAMFLLGYLFLGADVPSCLRSADCDADGAVEITDAVFLLGSLFLGTNRLPLPSPDCGSGSEANALSCETSTC